MALNKTCIGTSAQVNAIRHQAINLGLTVQHDPDAGTQIVYGPDGEEIYRALRSGHGSNGWLVRFDKEFFQ